MKPIFTILGRLAIVSAAAIGIATAANFSNHRSYWHGTIRRVQTTDFNILSTTLPTKLSYALIENKAEEIQHTLDSNYGLFGLVVTDCTTLDLNCQGQQILYITQSPMAWRQELRLEDLRYHPFDLLRDPPPLYTERGYDNAQDETWMLTGQSNSGKIIGRVYYIRGIPPTFMEDYQRWLMNPFSLNGTHKYYLLTAALFFTGGMASWLFIEWVYQRKRVQKRAATKAQEQAQRENNSLRRQLKQRSQQISELIAERESFGQQLQAYEQEQGRIHQLNQQIAELERQLQQFSQVNDTQQQDNQKDQQLQEMAQLLEQWRQMNEMAQQREAEAAQQREELRRSVAKLQREKEALEMIIHEIESSHLNRLEQSIIDRLEAHSKFQAGHWLVDSHLDVQPGRGRQFVDVLLIGRSYVVVIEAKDYANTIKATGDPKRTAWICEKPGGAKIPIESTGRNPYVQVSFYVNSVMKLLSREVSAKRVVVYGVVVFAEGADVSLVSNHIGQYSRITTLDNLVDTIEELEMAAAFRTKDAKPQRLPYQIQALLNGWPIRRSA